MFLEFGAGQTSIEQVAQRAGVTRATVYRRFPDKSALLIQAIGSVQADRAPGALDWPDVDRMLTDWASYLSDPRNRRLLRRIYGSVDDYPELLLAYRNTHGGRRASAVLATLDRARNLRQLPPDSDLEVLLQILNGAILHRLGVYGDADSARNIKAYLTTVLKQVGYQPTRPAPGGEPR